MLPRLHPAASLVSPVIMGHEPLSTSTKPNYCEHPWPFWTKSEFVIGQYFPLVLARNDRSLPLTTIMNQPHARKNPFFWLDMGVYIGTLRDNSPWTWCCPTVVKRSVVLCYWSSLHLPRKSKTHNLHMVVVCWASHVHSQSFAPLCLQVT